MLFIDDDAIVRPWKPKNADGSFRVDNGFVQREVLTSIEEKLQHFDPHEGDPIAEHLEALGQSLSNLIPHLSNPESRRRLLSTASPAETQGVQWANSRIRLSSNALVGDPGTLNDLALLYEDREQLKKFGYDNDKFDRLLSSPRCAYNGKPWNALTNASYFLHWCPRRTSASCHWTRQKNWRFWELTLSTNATPLRYANILWNP
jgi:hypothetical protein